MHLLCLAVPVAAFSLCAVAAADIESTPAPPKLEAGVIQRGPTEGGWIEVYTGGTSTQYITINDRTQVVWHLDARVALPRTDLRPGQRIRYQCAVSVAERVEVQSLGPLAMEAAVEEFVA